MTPEDLRQANIEHFRKLLDRISDAGERARVERLLEEEKRKPDDAYPPKRASSGGALPNAWDPLGLGTAPGSGGCRSS
jgi:hypothetical protein